MARYQDLDLAPLGRFTGFDALTWGIPIVCAGLIGAAIGSVFDLSIALAIAFAFMSAGGVFYAGAFTIRQHCFAVLEQLGSYKFVKLDGLGWYNPLLDKIVDRNTYRAIRHQLYPDAGTEMDFTDASAPVKAAAWYSIVDPDAISNCNWNEVRRQTALWTYRYRDSPGRIAGILDMLLRPRLQALSLDEAQTGGDAVCEAAMVEAEPLMAELGAYPASDHAALVIEDIDIPDGLRQARDAVLTGRKRAAEAASELSAPILAMQQVRSDSARLPADQRIGDEIVRETIMESLAMKTLRETGANVNLIGAGIMDAVKSMVSRRTT